MHQFDGVGSTVFRDLELSQQVIPRLVDGRVLFQRRAAWKWRMGGLWDLGPLKIVTYAQPCSTAPRYYFIYQNVMVVGNPKSRLFFLRG